MLEQHALRYLLTRQLWALREKVPAQAYEEVTGSLAIAREGREYIVRWQRGGQSFEKTIARSDFDFYKKGDRADSPGVVGNFEAENVRRARLLALEAFGLNEDLRLFDIGKAGWRLEDKIALGWNILFCVGLFMTGQPGMDRFAPVLLAALLIEYVPKWGRLLASVALVGFVGFGFHLPALIIGLGYMVIQLLDSNPFLRGLRVAICVGVAIAGLVQIDFPTISPRDAFAGVAVLAALFPIVMFRWTSGIHLRALPLIAPFLAAGLIVEQSYVAAALLFGNAVICLVAKMYGWRLLPHPNAATFQGVSKTTRQ